MLAWGTPMTMESTINHIGKIMGDIPGMRLSPLGSDAPNGFPWLSQVFREGFQKKRKPPCFTMVHGDLYGFMLIYN